MNGRLGALLAFTLALALATGCGAGSTPRATPTPGPGPAPGGSEARSNLARETSPTLDPADVARVVAGNNAFALDLHRRLVEPGRNVMSSPFSVSMTLAMLWAGARGETAAQMAAALHFALPQARFHPAFNALDLAFEAPAACAGHCAPFTLHLANTAWAQQGFPFVPAYLDTLALDYGAGMSLVDFAGAPAAARKTINDAVAHATEDRIKDLLPEGFIKPETRLVLTNAVYFKGRWANEFSPGQTAQGPFRLLDGSAVDVPLMHGLFRTRGTAQPSYDAVELEYLGSHFAMTLIAPKAGTFESFEGALDAPGLEAVDAALATALVTLSMPRFGFESQRDLDAVLEGMGMKDAFDARADLSGITTADRLQVTGVVHKTFIAVNEEGTEAAAATAAGGAGSGAPAPTPEITVRLDRPFLFLVRDRTTGQILFLGRVVDPR